MYLFECQNKTEILNVTKFSSLASIKKYLNLKNIDKSQCINTIYIKLKDNNNETTDTSQLFQIDDKYKKYYYISFENKISNFDREYMCIIDNSGKSVYNVTNVQINNYNVTNIYNKCVFNQYNLVVPINKNVEYLLQIEDNIKKEVNKEACNKYLEIKNKMDSLYIDDGKFFAILETKLVYCEINIFSEDYEFVKSKYDYLKENGIDVLLIKESSTNSIYMSWKYLYLTLKDEVYDAFNVRLWEYLQDTRCYYLKEFFNHERYTFSLHDRYDEVESIIEVLDSKYKYYESIHGMYEVKSINIKYPEYFLYLKYGFFSEEFISTNIGQAPKSKKLIETNISLDSFIRKDIEYYRKNNKNKDVYDYIQEVSAFDKKEIDIIMKEWKP